MGLLAYDPEQVAVLRAALRNALDELRRVACADPAAASAMHLVRSSASQLESVWLPLTNRLLATDPLAVGQRRNAGIGSLQQSLIKVMADGYGWSVQADPLGDDAALVSAQEARALGARLNDVDPRSFSGDQATQDWVAGQLLLIAADPNLTAQFLANFHEWASLSNWLGWAHLLHSGGDPSQSDPAAAARIEQVMAGLAAIQWRAVSAGGSDIASAEQVIPQLDEMQPYAAALLASRMPLAGDALVAVTVELLQRYLDQPMTPGSDGPWGDKDFDTGPNTADLLLPLILCDQYTTVAYVHAAVARNPLLLFATANDQSLQQRAMVVAADPRWTTDPEAGDLLITLLRGFAGGADADQAIDISAYGFDPDWHSFLGALLAPWLLEFTALPETWGLSLDERNELLAFVLEDDAAMETLLARSHAIVDGIAADIDAHKPADADAAAGVLSAVLQLFVNEATLTAQIGKNQWDLMWTLAGVLLGALAGGPASGVAIDTATLIGSDVAERYEWFGAPDVTGATLNALVARQAVFAGAAAAVAASTTRQLISQGVLPEGTPPPPPANLGLVNPDAAYNTAFRGWKLRNGIQLGSPAGDRLDTMVYAFVGAAIVAEHAAEKGADLNL